MERFKKELKLEKKELTQPFKSKCPANDNAYNFGEHNYFFYQMYKC